MFKTLISPQQLTDHMAHAREDLVVLDCNFNLSGPHAGSSAYDEGHVPHAQYADLNSDLSGAHCTSDGVFAARLWCLARWLGHVPVAVLDGQYQAWVAVMGGLGGATLYPGTWSEWSSDINRPAEP